MRRSADLRVNDAPAPGPALRLAAADLPLRVTNAGAEPTLAVVTAFGVPTQPEPAQGNGYRIERQLLTLDGAPADPGGDRAQRPARRRRHRHARARPRRRGSSSPTRCPPGSRSRTRTCCARARPGSSPGSSPTTSPRHSEFRADRFAAAVDWQGAAPFRLAYMVRAVSPGQLPPPGGERRGHVPAGLPRPHRRRGGHRAGMRRGARRRRSLGAGAGARGRRLRRDRSLDRRDGAAAAGAGDLHRRRRPRRHACSRPTPSPTDAGDCRWSPAASIAAISRSSSPSRIAGSGRHPGVDPLALARAARAVDRRRPGRLRGLDPDDAGRPPARGRADRHARRQAPPDARGAGARAAASTRTRSSGST